MKQADATHTCAPHAQAPWNFDIMVTVSSSPLGAALRMMMGRPAREGGFPASVSPVDESVSSDDGEDGHGGVDGDENGDGASIGLSSCAYLCAFKSVGFIKGTHTTGATPLCTVETTPDRSSALERED